MSNLHELHGRAAQVVARATEAAINKCDDGLTASKAYIGIGAAIGALEPLAFILSNGGDMDNDRLLFSALMVARAIRIAKCEERGKATEVYQHTEFGATIIFEVLEQFQKLTGRNIDHKLNPAMVEAARDPECRAEMDRQREMCMAQDERLHATVN